MVGVGAPDNCPGQSSRDVCICPDPSRSGIRNRGLWNAITLELDKFVPTCTTFNSQLCFVMITALVSFGTVAYLTL